MMYYKYPERSDWKALIKRALGNSGQLEKPVKKILRKVKEKGDKAVLKFTKRLDGVTLKSLEATAGELNNAARLLSHELKTAIQQAKKNIEAFHAMQKEIIKKAETMPGVSCWRKTVGIERVGLYIPGGTAPLFSTVLMLAVPAKLAGCKEIILCTPPSKDGTIHPAILYSAQLCGVTKVFKAGGAQAIAAMAYGTESIPQMFKIFGPGNPYVTMAKQLVMLDGVAIDVPAGPSELLVIADDTAVPAFVAADLLSQAEHGPDSQVMLISTSEVLAQRVMDAVTEQLDILPRKSVVAKALQNSKLIIVNDIKEAVDLSNLYAPEHLMLSCADAEVVSEMITSAGSVFIGNYSPESVGDYASGTNHTLPTNGFAAMYSGVSLDSFVKKITFQKLEKEGLKNISATVMAMAAAEGLDAHKKAVAIRLNN